MLYAGEEGRSLALGNIDTLNKQCCTKEGFIEKLTIFQVLSKFEQKVEKVYKKNFIRK